MGGGGSKATSESNTTIVSKSLIDKTNETLNKNISNSFMSNIQANKNAVENTQALKIKRINTGGAFKLSGIDFSQYVQVKFENISVSEVKKKATSAMIGSIFDTIKKNASADVQDKLAADASTLAGGLGIPAPSSETNSSSNFQQETDVNITLKNVVANVVERNTKDMNVQECTNSLRNNQTIEVEDVNARGDFEITLVKMDQVADAVMKCEAVKKTAQGVIDQISQELGLKTDETTETKKATDAKTSAKSEDALGKVGEGVGSGIASIGSGIGSAFGAAGMAMMIIPLIIGVVILVILYKVIGGGGSSGKSKGQFKGQFRGQGKKGFGRQRGGFINNMDPNTLMIMGGLYILYKLMNKKEKFEMVGKLSTLVDNKTYYVASQQSCNNTCDKSVVLVDDESKANIYGVKDGKINIDACLGTNKQDNLTVLQNNGNIQLKGDDGSYIGICKFRGKPISCNKYKLICVGEQQNTLDFKLV